MRPIITKALRLVTVFFALVAPVAAEGDLKTVASIRPIHSLLAGITEGVSTPVLLVKHQASPHHYTLRPSEKRLLRDADLVFWIGPGLETFLPTILASTPKGHDNVRLDESPGLTLLDMRSKCCNHNHGHAKDPHIWLSPKNAIKMAEYMAAVLMIRDPNHRGQYVQNLEKVKKRLVALDAELKRTLKSVQKVPFLVFHDGYQYFEQAYHLNGVGVIALNPELPISSRRLEMLRDTIQQQKVHCLFSEPQWGTHLVDALAHKYGINVGMIDPLGAETPKAQDAYFHNMRLLATTMGKCLEKQ